MAWLCGLEWDTIYKFLLCFFNKGMENSEWTVFEEIRKGTQ